MAKRVVAFLVLLVAAWLLFKFVVGAAMVLATGLAIVVAIIAVIWALSVLN